MDKKILLKHNERIMRELGEWPKYKQIKRIDARCSRMCGEASDSSNQEGQKYIRHFDGKRKELYYHQKMMAYAAFGKMFNEFNKRQKPLKQEAKDAETRMIILKLLEGRM